MSPVVGHEGVARYLGRDHGWLGSPTPGLFEIDESSDDPFVRYRRLSWTYRHALDERWDDDRYVAAVERIEAAIAGVDGAGFTVTPFGAEPGLDRGGVAVTVKDETHNVSASHKARHLMGLALRLAVDDVAPGRPLAIASCGNAAVGAAVVARAAGRPLDVYIPVWADEPVVARLDELGARIHVCGRRPGELGDPTFARFREAVDAGAVAFGVQATENPWTIDGGKTIGWELAEAFADAGAVPDHLFVQIGGGALAASCVQGLVDAHGAGLITDLPRFHAVQAEGCAPLVRAWDLLAGVGDAPQAMAAAIAQPERFMWAWDDPQSVATGILDDVTHDWIPVVWSMYLTDGFPVTAPEAAIVHAHRHAHTVTDIAVSATGTAGYAGLCTLIEWGGTVEGETATVLFTGRDFGPAPTAAA
jgi:threonine synthase